MPDISSTTITYFLILVIAVLLYVLMSFSIVKNSYWGNVKISFIELRKHLNYLLNNESDASILFFRQLNKWFKVTKKQNRAIWWVEINANTNELEKLKFHLRYNSVYLDFISTEYYKQYNQSNGTSIFLGHDINTINLILVKLVGQFFDIEKDEVFYIKYKNMKPFDNNNNLTSN